jgi:hypothetical protein
MEQKQSVNDNNVKANGDITINVSKRKQRVIFHVTKERLHINKKVLHVIKDDRDSEI